VTDAATPTELAGELRRWLADRWEPDLSLRQWRERLVEGRWAAPSWPAHWHGRGLPAWADDVVATGLADLGAPGRPGGVATNLAAPTLLAHGADPLLERFLAPILTGAETWCQLFSEPGAGSDLAGLGTRAELDGDEWVVSGQKVWTTSAHHADLGLLLARTDLDAPKHRGITYLVLPMRQAGVTVRPLRQMNGHASFNEVFLDETRVPRDWVIGEVGGGWPVARTTLAHERRFAGMHNRPPLAGSGRAVEEARVEAAEQFAPYVWYPQRAGRVDLLAERARATGTAADPVVRDAIAGVLARHRVGGWTAARARANRAAPSPGAGPGAGPASRPPGAGSSPRPPGAEGSIGKLALSEVARTAAAAHTRIAGAAGMLAGDDAPDGGVVAEVLVSVPAQSIAGGTDEIQRTIVAETILGLPREPGYDRELPYRLLPRNT
jgi:alkylation response protein AidB-like acyl-CoA dehydrogenase